MIAGLETTGISALRYFDRCQKHFTSRHFSSSLKPRLFVCSRVSKKVSTRQDWLGACQTSLRLARAKNASPHVPRYFQTVKMQKIQIHSGTTVYTDENIFASYTHRTSIVTREATGALGVTPQETHYVLKTGVKVPKLGVMLVGWGGNNGSTVTAAILANKLQLSWKTREGTQKANYYGSVAMASTVRLGIDSKTGQEVYVPFFDVVPMVNPNDIVLGGWDISSDDLYAAAEKAHVLEPDLKQQLREELSRLKPLPSIYSPTFIASNQKDRANNIIGGTKAQQLEKIRADIRNFKVAHGLDSVILLWTATTERFAEISSHNADSSALLKAIQDDHAEVSPSTIFAVASILEKCPFINGSPQNTFVPGLVDLATEKNVMIAGDDFKSGQTKMKAVMTDFLVNAGIKPLAITSYNHLGNNDGKNLSEQPQFRSKEISKTNLVDDIVRTNRLLYAKNESPDHTVVIKYVPAVGDSKRALDEYYSEIFMGGRNTIAMHNTCEDSLLASPLIIDLVLFCELFTRVEYKIVPSPTLDASAGGFHRFHPVLSLLAYFLKAPLFPAGSPTIQSLFRQRSALESLVRACVGLDGFTDLPFEHIAKLPY